MVLLALVAGRNTAIGRLALQVLALVVEASLLGVIGTPAALQESIHFQIVQLRLVVTEMHGPSGFVVRVIIIPVPPRPQKLGVINT